MTTVSPEVIDKWRSEFEQCHGAHPRFENGLYVDSSIQTLWGCWFQARKTVSINLPGFQKSYSMDSYWPGYNDGLRDAENAIESQGYCADVKIS